MTRVSMVPDEGPRIVGSGRTCRLMIEREDLHRSRVLDRLDERRLPDLASPVDDDDRRIGERLVHLPCYGPREVHGRIILRIRP